MAPIRIKRPYAINDKCIWEDGENNMHAIFPTGFTGKDRELMQKHIDDTDGYSVKDKNMSKV